MQLSLDLDDLIVLALSLLLFSLEHRNHLETDLDLLLFRETVTFGLAALGLHLSEPVLLWPLLSLQEELLVLNDVS